MATPYIVIVDLLVIIFFIVAFLTAEKKGKFLLAGIMVVLFALPYVFPIPLLSWIVYFAKICFGISCYIFVKRYGFL